MKINCDDLVSDGVTLEEFIETCLLLEKTGIAGIEVSGGIAESASRIVRKGINSPEKEGYFLYGASALKQSGVNIPVMSVGGFRTKSVCQQALDHDLTDIISLGRALITEPDLPIKWRNGSGESSRCISCNKCLKLRGEPTHCVHWMERKNFS